MGVHRFRLLGAATLLGSAVLAPALAAGPVPSAGARPIARSTGFGAQVTVGFTGITSPNGVAVAPDGSVVATSYPDAATNPARVLQKPAGTQVTLPFGEDAASPYGVAVDSSGDVFMADTSNNQVYELTNGGDIDTSVGFTGLSSPTGVAVDGSGNVFVADSGNARIEEMSGSTQTTVGFTGLQNPYGVAVDGSGNVYVADADAGNVQELDGATQTTVGFTGLDTPDGIAVDSAGDLFVSDAGNNDVVELPNGGSQATLGFSGLSSPAGVAVSSNGSVYVADADNDRVVELPIPSNTAAQSFVTAAYTDFIGRAPTDPELTAGVTAVGDLSSGKRAAFLSTLANSDTYISALVNKLYNDTLGRDGDSGGVTFWVNQLKTKKKTVAQVAANFYASAEYFTGIGGGTNTSWVTDLYHKILLRDPDSGLSYWVGQATSKGRLAVSLPFFQSTESLHTRVKTGFEKFLGREPDSSGLTFWSGQIKTKGDLALAVSLAGSTEYLNRSATRFP